MLSNPYHENPELVQFQTHGFANTGSQSIIPITPGGELLSRKRLKRPDDLNGIKIKLHTGEKVVREKMLEWRGCRG